MASFVDNHGGPRTKSLEAVLRSLVEEVGRMLGMGSGQRLAENGLGKKKKEETQGRFGKL